MRTSVRVPRAALQKARAVTIAALAPFRNEPVPRPVDDDFSALYRRYRPQLIRYVTHHFGPRDADEITQEALTRALRSLETDRTEAETWAWLVRVARNVAHDLARARRICEATDDGAVLADDVPDDGILPEPAALLDERRRLVRRALKMLPPSQRRILVLYEVDELNCPAIAGLVGSTEDAVRKALQRARRRFAAEVRALSGGSLGTVAFWLRGLRRKAVKTMPAASASTAALCAIVGTVAVSVTVSPAVPRELSPRLAPPVASSRPNDVLDDASGLRDRAAMPLRASRSGGRSDIAPPSDAPREDDNTTRVKVGDLPGPLAPGERTVVVVEVSTPYTTRLEVRKEIESEDRPGIVCYLEHVECESETKPGK